MYNKYDNTTHVLIELFIFCIVVLNIEFVYIRH